MRVQYSRRGGEDCSSQEADGSFDLPRNQGTTACSGAGQVDKLSKPCVDGQHKWSTATVKTLLIGVIMGIGAVCLVAFVITTARAFVAGPDGSSWANASAIPVSSDEQSTKPSMPGITVSGPATAGASAPALRLPSASGWAKSSTARPGAGSGDSTNATVSSQSSGPAAIPPVPPTSVSPV